MAERDYKPVAEALWQLLDNISTAGDMAKGDDAAFRRMADGFCEQRGKYLESDGYKLYWPGTMPKNESEPVEAPKEV